MIGVRRGVWPGSTVSSNVPAVHPDGTVLTTRYPTQSPESRRAGNGSSSNLLRVDPALALGALIYAGEIRIRACNFATESVK